MQKTMRYNGTTFKKHMTRQGNMYIANNAFKRDSCRVAFLVCGEFKW